jgi:DNA segregation ATPase FtsK/SpoIIIE, S-DNA-T family
MSDKNQNPKKEIIGLFYVAAALIFASAYYLGNLMGIAGIILRNIGFGLIGIVAYTLPVILLYMALDYFLEKEAIITRSRLLYISILIVVLAALIQLFAIPYESFCDHVESVTGRLGATDGLIQLWHTGIDGFGPEQSVTHWTGGIIGGILAYSLTALANKLGAAIILFAVLISELILIFNISFSKAILATKKRVDQTIRSRIGSEKIFSEKKKVNYDVTVGDEEPKTRSGFFKIPSFLGGEDPAKDKEDSTVEQSMDRAIDFSDEDALTPGVLADPNIDLPAGIRRIPPNDATKTISSVEGVSSAPSNDTPTVSNESKTTLHTSAETAGEETSSLPPVRPYVLPSPELLSRETASSGKINHTEIRDLGRKLEKTLDNFGITARVVNITSGPIITRFELSPGPGVKVSRIVSLSDDIALSLAATGVRIEAPIPGKSAIGVEVPKKDIVPVALRNIIESPEFKNQTSPLACVLGRDIPGNPVICDIAKMPHMLIAGATGSGKSVCINSILISILFRASPQDVKMLIIDPKVVELSSYNGIPHLLTPVVTHPKKAANSLNWAVNEMTKRYALFAEHSVRDLHSYNIAASTGGFEKIPMILIVIDELSDLMATSPREVEDSISRLTAMARATGIHLLVATQRPSVDVITGLIKANIPTRIAFAVTSQVDSRTILDGSGAEKLLGKGDMLFLPLGASKAVRAQGSFVTDKEVERVTAFIKAQNTSGYDAETSEAIHSSTGSPMAEGESETNEKEDELFNEAVGIVVDAKYASISLLQRRINIGYPRAARLIDRMQEKGFVGPFEGSKPRKVLITPQQWAEYRAKGGS